VSAPVSPNLPVVRGDHTRLAQALSEIIENAITFTPAGGRVTVQVDAVNAGGQPWVTIAVHDTGPGIPPGEQPHVFERFYRGGLADAGEIPGTGLGLAIAREIVSQHQGRIVVESEGEMGKGVTFTVWLPASRQVKNNNAANGVSAVGGSV
jgi:signal transduction histidine kinase